MNVTLPTATRMIVVKADGSVSIHSDGGYKPLNWMTAPCTLTEDDGQWRVTNKAGEHIEIDLHEIHATFAYDLGAEPGLVKDQTEDDIQAALAADPTLIEPGLTLLRREHRVPGLGPVDLLCVDADGRTVAVEIKRTAELDAVEQVCRYREVLDLDPSLRPVRAMLVAPTVKPQARAMASLRDVDVVIIDADALRGVERPQLSFF